MHKWCAIALILLAPGVAWAEGTGSSSARATGFMIDVNIGVSTPTLVSGLGGTVVSAWSLSPRLVLGGQIRRVGIGVFFGVNLSDQFVDESDPEDPATWAMYFGPDVDIELWSRNAAGLVFDVGLPIYFSAPSEGLSGAGFGIDLSIGGRYWFDRCLALGLKAGTLLTFMFWEQDMDPTNAKWMNLGWSVYGAIELRFVAGG